ncbi:hypothetical protein lerEdw1_012669 [Lerista edwardsae]|nr:hypothetical protein lerEdw1_012669 [Lerista edwardsae]
MSPMLVFKMQRAFGHVESTELESVLQLSNRLTLFFLLLSSAELEFVQIIIIIVVITVMIVVIICLLNHYKVSTRSFIGRQSQSRRQEEPLQPVSGKSQLHLAMVEMDSDGLSKQNGQKNMRGACGLQTAHLHVGEPQR